MGWSYGDDLGSKWLKSLSLADSQWRHPACPVLALLTDNFCDQSLKYTRSLRVFARICRGFGASRLKEGEKNCAKGSEGLGELLLHFETNDSRFYTPSKYSNDNRPSATSTQWRHSPMIHFRNYTRQFLLANPRNYDKLSRISISLAWINAEWMGRASSYAVCSIGVC